MCEQQKKDFSLLRPFDLEAAKAGEPFVCWDGSPRQYIGGPDKSGRVAIMDEEGLFQLSERYQENYRMAPLAWVEGKPVYKGDVLYYKDSNEYFYGMSISGKNHRDHKDDGLQGNVCWVPKRGVWKLGSEMWAPSFCYTWNPPKTKRTIKLLAYIKDGDELTWWNEMSATHPNGPRVPSEDKTVEIED